MTLGGERMAGDDEQREKRLRQRDKGTWGASNEKMIAMGVVGVLAMACILALSRSSEVSGVCVTISQCMQGSCSKAGAKRRIHSRNMSIMQASPID